MPKLVKNEFGYWEIRYADDRGRSRRLSTRRKVKREALKKLAAFNAIKQRPPEPEQQTVDELLDHYLADREPHVNAYATLEFSADKLKPYFGACQPRHVTPTMVRGYTALQRSAGQSDGTIRRELGVLRAALSFGRKSEWIETEPFIPLPPTPPGRERWLTRPEAERLVAACRATHMRTFVMLGLHTGARAGAILDLTWDRVDMDQKRIWYPMPGRPTTKKRRVVAPINSVLWDQLEKARQLALTRWVIERRGQPVGSVKKGFKAACEKAGLEDVRIHDLRRTCASWLVQAGISFSEVAAYLGDTESTVRKHYGHFSPDWLKGAAEALER